MIVQHVPCTLLLGAAGLTLVACSSSNGNGVGNGNGSGSAGTVRVCPKLSQADIQALLAQPITMVSEGDLTSQLLECDVNGLQLQMQTDDGDLGLYNAGPAPGDPDRHAVSGVGDEAYWSAVDSHSGTSRSTPTFAAHKGSATCLVSTNNDPSNFSMPYQNAPPPFAIANADVEAWVQKAEKVCLDFYAAVGL